MNEEYPSKTLERAVKELSKLPTIGRNTALRLALHLLRQNKEQALSLSESIRELVTNTHHCKTCHNISDKEICDICSSPTRDHSTICVVENIRNVMTLENTGVYHGVYHVLGGLISPIDGIGPQNLEIQSLFDRLKQGTIKEIIFALNPTMEGDTTTFYITRKLTELPIRRSTLARGIAIGDEIEYADEATLGRSLINRVELT